MSKLEIIKMIVPSIVGLSSGFTVRNIIANAASDPETLRDQAQLAVGALAIGSMVGACAKEYTDQWIDGMDQTWKKVQEMREEAAANKETQAESPS